MTVPPTYMPLSVFDAARYMLENSRWNISQLELQKLLYLGQMTHLGEHDSPLLRARFVALKYGPVNAELRESHKPFGVEPLWPNSIRGNSKAVRSGSTEKAVLDAVIDKLPRKSGASLVAITHWPDGAWKKTFESSDWTLEIPEALMREEYLARAKIAEAELLKS